MNRFSELLKFGMCVLIPCAVFLLISIFSAEDATGVTSRGGLSIKKGTVAAKGLALGPNNRPVWVMYDAAGDVVLVIGEDCCGHAWEGARVIPGETYKAYITQFDRVTPYHIIMSADDYNALAGFVMADGTTAGKVPGMLRPHTRSVVMRITSDRLDPTDVVLLESPLDLNSLDRNISSGSVLLYDDGKAGYNTQYPPGSAKGPPASIGYYTAFYTGDMMASADPDDYNTEGRKSLTGYNAGKHRLWGPIANTPVSVGNYRTSTDENGFFSVSYMVPPCPGFNIRYCNRIVAEIITEPFNPKSSSFRSYLVSRTVCDHCMGLSEAIPGTTVAGLAERIKMREEEARIADNQHCNITVSVALLAGYATMRNDISGSTGVPPEIPYPDDSTVTEYHYAPDVSDETGPPPDLNLDDNTIPDIREHTNNIVKVWLGNSAPPSPPSLTRLPDRSPDISHQGLLKTVSRAGLEDTDIYVYNQKGRRIATRKGLKSDEASPHYGAGTSQDSGTGIRVDFRVLMRGPDINNPPPIISQWESATNMSQGPDPEPYRIGDRVRVIMINRTSGYMGTAFAKIGRTRYNPSGNGTSAPVISENGSVGGTTLITFTTEEEIVMRPPNLKVWAERRYMVEAGLTKGADRKHLIGFEGSGLTSDKVIVLTTRWHDHDDMVLPDDLPGYTGRLAKVTGVDTLSGVAGSGSGSSLALFSILPGEHVQLVQVPVLGTDAAHYYVHVNAKPPDESPNFGSTGAGQGPLLYRPAHYVPFMVQVYNEAKTLAAEMNRRKALAMGIDVGKVSPYYEWLFRPEMQFSLADLIIKEITSTDNDGTEHVVLFRHDGANMFDAPWRIFSDKEASLLYTLQQDDENLRPMLERFGSPRVLVFSAGGQEVTAFMGQDRSVALKNFDHFDLLEPDNYILLKFYQNWDDPNVLWEYAFYASTDLDADSDNNNQSDLPDRTDAEDKTEDDPAWPGKIIPVHYENGELTPIVFELPDAINPAYARTRLTFTDHIRMRAGNTELVSGLVYGPGELGPGRTVILHAEGARGGSDGQITAATSPGGGVGFVCKDTVRITVAEISSVTVSDASHPGLGKTSPSDTPLCVPEKIPAGAAAGSAGIRIQASVIPGTDGIRSRVLWRVRGSNVSHSAGNFGGPDPLVTLMPTGNNRKYFVDLGYDRNSDSILQDDEVQALHTTEVWVVRVRADSGDANFAPGAEKLDMRYTVIPAGYTAAYAKAEIFRKGNSSVPVSGDESIAGAGANVLYQWDGRANLGGGAFAGPENSPYTVRVCVSERPDFTPSSCDSRDFRIEVESLEFNVAQDQKVYMNDPDNRVPVSVLVRLRKKDGSGVATEVPVYADFSFSDPDDDNTFKNISYEYQPGKFLGKRGDPDAVHWEDHPDADSDSADGYKQVCRGKTVTDPANQDMGKTWVYFRPSGVGGDDFRLTAKINHADGSELISEDSGVLIVWRFIKFDHLCMMAGLNCGPISGSTVNNEIQSYFNKGFVEYSVDPDIQVTPVQNVDYIGLWTNSFPHQENWNTLQAKTVSETPNPDDTPVTVSNKAQAWAARISHSFSTARNLWVNSDGILENSIIAIKSYHPKYDTYDPKGITNEWQNYPDLLVSPAYFSDVHPDSIWKSISGMYHAKNIVTIRCEGYHPGNLPRLIAHEVAHATRSFFHRQTFGPGDHPITLSENSDSDTSKILRGIIKQ